MKILKTKDKDYQKKYLQNIRRATIEVLGGKCTKCYFTDWRALQIDHINGGGSQERIMKLYNGSFHKHVIKSVLDGELKYQLLCANCNWIKRYENKESTGNRPKSYPLLEKFDKEDVESYY